MKRILILAAVVPFLLPVIAAVMVLGYLIHGPDGRRFWFWPVKQPRTQDEFIAWGIRQPGGMRWSEERPHLWHP